MEIQVSKSLDIEHKFKINIFNHNMITHSGSQQGYVLISLTENTCAVFSKYLQGAGAQNFGTYALREHKDQLQYFNCGWIPFEEEVQEQWAMEKGDKLILEGEDD